VGHHDNGLREDNVTALVYIYENILQNIERGPRDITGIPPGASLIVEAPEWETMCAEAGGEPALIAALGVVTDRREEMWQS